MTVQIEQLLLSGTLGAQDLKNYEILLKKLAPLPIVSDELIRTVFFLKSFFTSETEHVALLDEQPVLEQSAQLFSLYYADRIFVYGDYTFCMFILFLLKVIFLLLLAPNLISIQSKSNIN